ncbi:hypothetical protein [Pseudomonas brassicacearum]|uniref:Uncharacterized protein n=1 Tax=Pseudomonas brassicacearum TaxID=930166 RepID=A0A423GT81_9PSED|nr:hypothetical protein [Pseudomonas brassicacearum]ROM99270.1 hypothetical protein BK658_11895 [Pseudomonas brassicacearum]
MNDIKDTSNNYEDLLSFFNYTSIGMLYKLTPFLFSEENQQALDKLIGIAKIELISLLDQINSEHALNKKIEQWQNQNKSSKTTRVIVKLINHSPHTFNIAQTSLPLGKSERESFLLPAYGKTAFKSDFAYTYAYPWPKNKIMFNQFVDFIDQNVGVRFDLGMIMNTSFGVLSPTHTARVKNTVTSIGSSNINCSTQITSMGESEPFNFEVEIRLG